MTKVIFILIRGIGLFCRYLKGNLVSMAALAALFTVLHALFAIGLAMADFADNAARFDSIRVYSANVEKLASELEKLNISTSVEIYTPADTKKYIQQSAPSLASANTLPEELFPSFVEVTVREDYQNTVALKDISAKISDMPGVDSVSYGQEWAEQMSRGKDAIWLLIAFAVVMFTLVGAVITYQTVNVTLYRYRKEIVAYSIVGGTAPFIILPFVVLAAIIAIICALASFAAYMLIHAILLSPASVALKLPIALTFQYGMIFLPSAAALIMLSGFASARTFLYKQYHEE